MSFSDHNSMGFCEGTRTRREMCFSNYRDPQDVEREWFKDLLWSTFPNCRSENQLAATVADFLSAGARPINPRTVRNWLRCENTPHFRYVVAIICVAGADSIEAIQT